MGEINKIVLNESDYSLLEQILRFQNDWPSIAIYCRVSTEDQATEHFSLEMQVALCLEKCKREFSDQDINVVIIKEDMSGKLPYYKPGLNRRQYRKGLTALVDAIKLGRVQYLVFYRSDRMSRSQRVWGEFYEDILLPYGIEFFSCTEPIDSSRNHGMELLTNILMALNEHNRKVIVSNVTHGLAKRLEENYPLGSPCYGWRMEDKRFLAPRQRAGIEPDPDREHHIRFMIQSRLSGWSYSRITSNLNEQGVPTRKGRKTWHQNTVRKLILNPLHYGLVRNGAGEPKRGAHYDKKFFDEDLYHVVLEMDKESTRSGVRAESKNTHVFASVIRCEECGERLAFSHVGKDAFYICYGDNLQKPHTGYRVRVEIVEEKLIRHVQKAASKSELLDEAQLDIAQIIDEEDGGLVIARERALEDIKKIQIDIDNWSEKYNSGCGIAQRDYESYCSKLHEKRNETEARLARIDDQIQHRKSREEQISVAIDLLRRVPEMWKKMNIDEKRAFVHHIVDDLTVKSEKDCIKVTLKLVVGKPAVFKFYRYGKAPDGLESLTPAQLTQAYYLNQGYDDAQIARLRDISISASKLHKSKLMAALDTRDIKRALRLAAPLVAKNKDKLLIGRRKNGFHHAHDFAPGEIQTLELKAKHLTDKQIARELEVSPYTVRDTLRRVYRKLDVHDIRGAVIVAQRKHLIPGPTPWSDEPTQKQLEVLKMLQVEANQACAAQRLGITLVALKTRTRSMRRKFGCANTLDLMKYAHEKGWI